MESWFRITAVLPMAVFPSGDSAPLPNQRSMNRRAGADRARAAAARLRVRTDPELRETLLALADAVGTLELEVYRIQRKLLLYDSGIALRPELASLGGDGIGITRRLEWEAGTEVDVVFTLALRDAEHLLSIRARVEEADEGTDLAFTGISEDQRDLIVAFVFQQQARERRRDLDATGTD